MDDEMVRRHAQQLELARLISKTINNFLKENYLTPLEVLGVVDFCRRNVLDSAIRGGVMPEILDDDEEKE